MKRYAIARVKEECMQGEHSQQFTQYVQAKYSKYGYRKNRTIEYNPESQENHYRWVENIGEGLRHVGASHDIVRLNHTGWFTDDVFQETVHGSVYQLPARDGKAQYVPAVDDPCNDNCALVDFRSVTDDKEDAARWADSMAERYAEDEREYAAKDRAEQRGRDDGERCECRAAGGRSAAQGGCLMTSYTLGEIRNGTGFAKGARFVPLEDARELAEALHELLNLAAGNLDERQQADVVKLARVALWKVGEL